MTMLKELLKCSKVRVSLPSLITGHQGEGTEVLLQAGVTKKEPVAGPLLLFNSLFMKHRLAITQPSLLAKAYSHLTFLALPGRGKSVGQRLCS